MIVIYNVFLGLLFIPAVIILFLRSPKRFVDDLIVSFSERLAISSVPQKTSKRFIWIHCASLGEVKALENLVKRFSSNYEVLLTVLTSSAREYAKKNNYTKHVFFAPLDFSFLIKIFIKRFNPVSLIIFETELWPGMIVSAAGNKIKIFLINGRISANSFKHYKLAKLIMKKVMKNISFVAARSNEDMCRFKELGVIEEKIGIFGNIKYDAMLPKEGLSKKDLGISEDKKVFVCGSTRSGEEEILVEMFLKLKLKFVNLVMIIAPRHIERAGEIAALLSENNVKYALRTKQTGSFDVLILNTFGELQKIYSFSDIVFVGGSLVDKGGQNPIEPALYCKPVVFGPYMHNFEGEAVLLESMGGGIRAKSSVELYEVMEKLLSDDSYRASTGQKALNVVQSQKGAAEKTYKYIIENLK